MKEKSDPVVVAGQAFLKRFGEDCGKRLQEILPDIGLRLHYRNANNYEGALLRMKGVPRGYIVLSRSVLENTRQRFTLAHEIGHYLLPDQQDLSQPCGKAQIESWDETLTKPERDANQFAAEILMPRSVMLPYLRESPRFSHVEQIARACETSLTASAYRLAELSSFRVAIVWSRDRRVRWYKASDEFVRWVRKGQLDPNSFAFDAFEGKAVPPSFESVPASAWLFEKGLRSDARILEHSIPLLGYEAVLSLLFIPEPIEEWDDTGTTLDELDPEEFTLRRKSWPGHR
jgi:Zn-dependent peptidase ImmA (M78 family)